MDFSIKKHICLKICPVHSGITTFMHGKKEIATHILRIGKPYSGIWVMNKSDEGIYNLPKIMWWNIGCHSNLQQYMTTISTSSSSHTLVTTIHIPTQAKGSDTQQLFRTHNWHCGSKEYVLDCSSTWIACWWTKHLISTSGNSKMTEKRWWPQFQKRHWEEHLVDGLVRLQVHPVNHRN